MDNKRSNDLLLGLLGGAIGVMAMDLFSQEIVPLFTQNEEEQSGQQQAIDRNHWMIYR